MVKKDALWAQVLRFKCGCGNLTIPTMKCGSRVSHLWRGICNQWSFIDQGILWIMKSGKGVNFWQDPWVSNIGVLSDHSLVHLSEADWHLSVREFAAAGLWNWHILNLVLPPNICNKIACIRPRW